MDSISPLTASTKNWWSEQLRVSLSLSLSLQITFAEPVVDLYIMLIFDRFDSDMANFPLISTLCDITLQSFVEHLKDTKDFDTIRQMRSL